MQEANISNFYTQELIHNLPKGLLKWLNLPKNRKALFITAGSTPEQDLGKALEEAGLKVTTIHFRELGKQEVKPAFDYIFTGTALEYGKADYSVKSMLETANGYLNPSGKMFLFLNNRLGIRYFCGDADPCTGIIFDGIENYPVRGNETKETRRQLYDKAEIITLLEASGFTYYKFYSVFPDLNAPQILMADGHKPNEELDVRLFPAYHRADSVFLREERLYSTLIQNQLFHAMANAYLVECAATQEGKNSFEHADYITVSMNRGKELAFSTIMYGTSKVIKKPVFAEGFKTLENIASNTLLLSRRGIPVANGKIENGIYATNYLEGESLLTYLRDLLRKDLRAFLEEMDRLWDYIIRSSDLLPYSQVIWEDFDPWWNHFEKAGITVDRTYWRRTAMKNGGEDAILGPILKDGFIDLIVINAIMTKDGPVFFDQEFKRPQIPVRSIMLKNIELIYRDQFMEKIYPVKNLYERYGITEHKIFYHVIEYYFWQKLVNLDALADFRSTRERNTGAVVMNQFSMNQAERVRSMLLTDIFHDAADKDLYVFGAGRWADKFIAMYRHEYKIAGIIDNDPQKKGKLIYNLPVCGPEILHSLDPDHSKVIVCVKDCASIVRQLMAYGVKNVAVYNAWQDYPLHKNYSAFSKKDAAPKKYRLGYVAGVFDLFHIGHLNLLQRAKEQCEYLIVGIVTDEGVRKNKHVTPVIPFEQRLAVVQACRYVDKAVEIPLWYCDTQDAWRKFQFDVQFSGSDYENDPLWLEKQRFLREHGSDLIFFPYTEATSTTRIKSRMREG